MPTGRGMAPAFVGRANEVAAVQAGLEDADARLVLVVGEAGIGKTRLVTEALADPPGADRRTLVCACLPMAETLSLLPIIEAFRTLDAGRDGGSDLRSLLARLPAYVGREIARLLPELGEPTARTRDGEGSGTRDHLFAAVAEVLAVVSSEQLTTFLVEDVHWADVATLDLLTYLLHDPRPASITVLATSRSDEPSGGAPVLDWLAHVRRSPVVVEMEVPPMTPEDVAVHAAELVGSPVGAEVVAELCTRGQGSPFFTEQLVAAALADRGQGGLQLPSRLPGGLAELLARRWASVSPVSRTALAALAVAGRRLAEASLTRVVDADPAVVRVALTELARARLLGPADAAGGLRPRHALLAEAVAEELLPSERAALHARTAEVLEQWDDPALAGELAAHWAAAGSPADELRTTVAAARTAVTVSAFLDSASLWRRAIELSDELPEQAQRLGIEVPRLYLDATDALEAGGEGVRASLLAEESHRRFADWPDDAVAAAVIARAAHFRLIWSVASTEALCTRAMALFAGTPPSREHAEALLCYAIKFHSEGHRKAGFSYLQQAVDVAEAVGARAIGVLALVHVASAHVVEGQRAEAAAALDRARALAREAEGRHDLRPMIVFSLGESDVLGKLGDLVAARRMGTYGVATARRSGRSNGFTAWACLAKAAEAARELGDTASAVALLASVMADAPQRDRWLAHAEAAMVELLTGRPYEASQRLAAVADLQIGGNLDLSRQLVAKIVEVALWLRDPQRALTETEAVLAPLVGTEQEAFAADVLVLGVRACADLADKARASNDRAALVEARASLERVVSVADAMGGRPFADHPLLVRIPGDRADWAAERARAEGCDDPAL